MWRSLLELSSLITRSRLRARCASEREIPRREFAQIDLSRRYRIQFFVSRRACEKETSKVHKRLFAQDPSHLNRPNKRQLIFLRTPKARSGRVGGTSFERGLMINDLHDGCQPASAGRNKRRMGMTYGSADARFILQAVEVQLLTAHQSNE